MYLPAHSFDKRGIGRRSLRCINLCIIPLSLCTKVVNIRNIPAKLEQRRVCILPGGYRAEPSERRQRQREDQGRDGSADERVINTARGISFDLHLHLRSISLAFSRLSQDHEFRAAINLQKTKNNDYAPYDEIDSCHYFLSIPLLAFGYETQTRGAEATRLIWRGTK
jgi:hypothetical protein